MLVRIPILTGFSSIENGNRPTPPPDRIREGSGEQLAQWGTLGQQVEGTALAVGGLEVVDAHGVVDCLGDVFRGAGPVGRESGLLVRSTVGLTAPDTAAGQQHRHAVRPVVAAGSLGAAGACVA